MRKAIVRNNMILLLSALMLFFIIAFFSLYVFESRQEKSFMSYLLKEVETEYQAYSASPLAFVSMYEGSTTRVTILDDEGFVLADSKDAAVGQDKSQRPEIEDIGSVYKRTSDTIGIELLYMAKELENGQYLRVSIPLESQTNVFRNVILIIGVSGFLIAGIYYIGVNKVNRHILLPFEKIKKGMVDLNEGDYQMIRLDDKYQDINDIIHKMNLVNLSTSKYLNQVESYQMRLNTILNELQQAVLLFDQTENLAYYNKDSKELFGPLLTADKKALVVVNAAVTIAYDLSKIEFTLDEDKRTLHINKIPEPEINLNPDFEYYDVTADYLNPFEAGDYNTIKNNVKASLMKKVEASTLRTNAENRLLSELQDFYLLTNSMGWILLYEDERVENDFDQLMFKD